MAALCSVLSLVVLIAAARPGVVRAAAAGSTQAQPILGASSVFRQPCQLSLPLTLTAVKTCTDPVSQGPPTLRPTASADALRGLTAVHPATSSGGGASQSSWILAQRTEPLRRDSPQLVDDAATGNLVLFGGFICEGASCYPVNDTWTFDGSTWTQDHPQHSPSARYFASIAYDPAAGDVVLFGGFACLDAACSTTTAVNDTWTWDGTDWTERSAGDPTGVTTPSPRYSAAMAADPKGHVVLFGGCLASCPAEGSDTWAWNGASWSLQLPAASPSPRAAASMAYDAATLTTVLFGGSPPTATGLTTASDDGDTWTWDGSHWLQQTPASSPSTREAAGMTYDANRNLVVLFGGYDESQSADINAFHHDTWTWDGSTWTDATVSSLPQAARGSGAAVTYGATTLTDASQNWTVNQWLGDTVSAGGGTGIVGGNTATTLTLTAAWGGGQPADGTAYAVNPLPLAESPGVAYVTSSGKTVMIGGHQFLLFAFNCGNCGSLTDEKYTWTLDAGGWSRLPTTWPEERSDAVFVYDSTTHSAVLNGGFCTAVATLYCTDTWTWDGLRWTQQTGARPLLTFDFPAAYHPNSGQVVVPLGDDIYFDASLAQDTATWDGHDWTLTQSPTPAPREHLPTLAPDATGSAVLFGGVVNSGGQFLYSADTWRWNSSDWSKLQPPTSPPARASAQMDFFPDRQQTLLFGGGACEAALIGTPCIPPNDTWTWDGTTWTQQHPANSPPNHSGGAMAYNPGTRSMFLFGGVTVDQMGNASPVNDTWTWDGGSWTQQQPATSPLPMENLGMTQFPPADTVVIFSGFACVGSGTCVGRGVSDLWLWAATGAPTSVPETPVLPLLPIAAGVAGVLLNRRRRQSRDRRG
jgi:hypothetical protein